MHNFVAEELVTGRGLAVQYVPTLVSRLTIVTLSNVTEFARTHQSYFLNWSSHKVFSPFLIGGADIVLGIQLLASLNTIQVNLYVMFLIIQLNGKNYRLQEAPQKTHSKTSFQLLVEPVIQVIYVLPM